MLWARIIVSFLYSGFMLLAVASSFRKDKRLDILMSIGAVILIAANFLMYPVSFTAAVIALAFMHIAALVNGKRNGKINPAHHIVRLIISAIIAVLFWLS